MAVQIASILFLMVVIVVMIEVLMVEAPRKVASPRTEQWRQRSWVGAPITPQTPPDPEPPMPPDPPPPPDQCGPWALSAEVERLRAERDALVKVAIGVSEIINERESGYQCEWWMMDNAIDDYGRLPAAVRDEIEGLRDPFNTEADQ